MHLHTRNVNTAFRQLVTIFRNDLVGTHRGGVVKRQSRNGPVLMIDEPVTITYSHPRERVLFNTARDANPFFHLYEALWMLAGRNDVAPLAYYAKNMANYSDDGKTLNGAYGYRWRHSGEQRTDGQSEYYYDQWAETAPHRKGMYSVWRAADESRNMNINQLDILVNHLKADPTSRRAVLQMWNVEDDLLKVGSSKDVCCNLSVMFSLQEYYRSAQGVGMPDAIDRYLDMTVTNRSNDLVWGMLGADYVHFTFLQEYVAARLGVEVGKYHHFTNNLHVYTETNSRFKPDEWLAEPTWTQDRPYGDGGALVPLVRDPAMFERELPLFVAYHSSGFDNAKVWTEWEEPFLRDVADPMLKAYHWHKRGDKDGTIQDCLDNIQADDWRLAAKGWLERRKK